MSPALTIAIEAFLIGRRALLETLTDAVYTDSNVDPMEWLEGRYTADEMEEIEAASALLMEHIRVHGEASSFPGFPY